MIIDLKCGGVLIHLAKTEILGEFHYTVRPTATNWPKLLNLNWGQTILFQYASYPARDGFD